MKRIECRENDLYSDAELNVRNWDSCIASKDIQTSLRLHIESSVPSRSNELVTGQHFVTNSAVNRSNGLTPIFQGFKAILALTLWCAG